MRPFPSFCPLVVRLVALVALLGLGPLAHAAGYTWQSANIGGGGFVSGIVYHPTERNLVYARTDVGGAYRLNPSNGQWIALNDDLGGLNNEFMLLGVLSLAVDPNDANRLYLACGQYADTTYWTPPYGAILRSTDRGATWSRTALTVRIGGNDDGRNTGERLQVDPNDGNILFLGTTRAGLWKSTDAGVTWSQVTSFAPTQCTLVLFDKTTGSTGSATQTIFVGVASTTGSSLYRSTDGGATWTAIPGQPTGVMPHHADIAYGASRALYLAYANALGPNGASSGAVWKLNLTDGSWTNITPAAGSGGYGGISVCAANPLVLAASTLDRWSPRDAVYRSTDGGATWTDVLTSATIDTSSAPWAAAVTPHWIGDIRLDPFDPSRAMFNTGFGLFATTGFTSAATTWSFYARGLEESVPLMGVSPTSGAHLLSAIGDYDGFYHDDLAASPARFSPHYGTNTSIDCAANAPASVVRTYNSGTRGARSTDGGVTWTAFAACPSSSASGGTIAISADGTTLVWSQQNTVAYRSTNNGASWTACAGAPASASYTFAPVADRVNASKFYIYNQSSGVVYRSTDAGATFSAGATVPTWGGRLRTTPGQEGHLWLPCWTNGLRRSTDSGVSFSTVSTVQEANAIGFGMAATGQTYPAIFLWGKVSGTTGLYRSDDSGVTWIRINDDRHQFGYINWIDGDPRLFGRVYLGSSGRGVIYGDAFTLPALPSYDWAIFTRNVSGSYTPATAMPAGVTYSATGLPAWATLDPLTGTITGTPTTGDGAIVPVTLTALDAASGQTVSGQVNLLVAAAGSNLRIFALSARAQVLTDDNRLIPGIVVGGTAAQSYMIRAGGPCLPADQVPNFLADPQMELVAMKSTGTVSLASNDDWETGNDASAMRTAFASLGMGAYATGSKDAALLATLDPGVYTTVISGKDRTTGVGIMEVYDAGGAANPGQLRAISCRALVGTEANVLIPGLAMVGGGAKHCLIRVAGPQLAKDHLQNVLLPDPEITLYSHGAALAHNDDWETGNDVAAIQAATARIGTQFDAGSKDAAMLVTLVTGNYTFVISGKNGATGVVVVEIYLLD